MKYTGQILLWYLVMQNK